MLRRFIMLSCFLAARSLAMAADTGASIPSVTLSEQCPAGFELSSDGRCSLRTLYQVYVGVPGHGGVQAPLPTVRDGFTPGQIDLGRYLFFDRLLSADRRTACASCHHPDHGFADGLRTAAGFGANGDGPNRRGGQTQRRRTPTLWNVGFASRLFWDGHETSLEAQVQGPLFAANEMGNTPEGLLRDLNDNATYRRLFSQAFARGEGERIVLAEVSSALTAFQASLVSVNSRYDKYVHGDREALRPAEMRGMNVFRGFVARCSQCHTPPLFTNNELAVVGAPPVPGQPTDIGAGGWSSDPMMRGAFKVPTLRNITLTGPRYFQAGQMRSLEEAVRFYNQRRGHALPQGEQQAIHWHVHMLSPRLSSRDVKDIVSFLGALEDESFKPAVPAIVPSGLPVIQRLVGANPSGVLP